MNKAFTKESDNDDELEPNTPVLPAGFKNYIISNACTWDEALLLLWHR